MPLVVSVSCRSELEIVSEYHQPVSALRLYKLLLALIGLQYRNSFISWASDFYGHNDMDIVCRFP
jgi:hypothetical protein